MNSRMRGVGPAATAWLPLRSRLLTLMTLAGMAFLSFVPVHAGAAMTGSISGRILGGEEVQGQMCQWSVDVYGTGGLARSIQLNDPSSYTVSELEPGDYKVKFTKGCANTGAYGYLHPNPLPVSEYFNDSTSYAQSTPVHVTPGGDRKGISVLFGTDGTISGTVTDTSGTPLNDICVEAFDSNGDLAGVIARTTAGHYVVKALDTGSYRLKFSDCINPDDPSADAEFYDDKATLDTAVPISVTRGSDTAGIDAQVVTKPSGTIAEAAISKVKVKGPTEMKKGVKVTNRVTITNAGNAKATGVRLKVKGRGVSFGASVGTIPAGAKRTVRAKLKANRAGKVKLTFKVISSNAGTMSVERSITIRK